MTVFVLPRKITSEASDLLCKGGKF